MEINYELIGLGIFCTVGFMQWFKNIVKVDHALSWVYAIIMPFVGIVVGILLSLDIPFVKLALPIIVGSQLGFEGFVQNFLEKFKPRKE
jgi:drug/metabolite transporter (DMT)-like permease